LIYKYQDMPDDINALAQDVVDAIFNVHKNLGPGFPEKVYESGLCHELNKRAIPFQSQKIIKVIYPPDIILDPEYRLDIVINNQIILELKCVENILPVHQAQLYSYMKMANISMGFLVNFNVSLIRDGIKRQVIK
jgi:GxxExxY protein